MKELLEYCKTPKQKHYINLLTKSTGRKEAARKAGVTLSSFCRTIKLIEKQAAARGYAPEADYVHPVPEPHIARGISTYYNKYGKPTQQWVKSKLDRDKYLELLEESAAQFYDNQAKVTVPKFKKPKNIDKDVIPWFQIGDGHLGMLAHAAETGDDFDLKIATKLTASAFAILFAESPPGERCVINDLGDFTHYENMAGVTEASGNSLDFDGRFPKMIAVYVPLMRAIVEMALQRFQYVDIIINQGNHSRTNDIWMAELLRNVYSTSDRINVLNNTSIFIPYLMGDTFVLTTHSDKCRPNQAALVMATDYPEAWGASKFRYLDVGHLHHKFTSQEHPGVEIECFNTLAASDKWHHDKGYRSRRSITRLDRHRKYGNYGRRILSINEINDILARGGVKVPEISPSKRHKGIYEV